MISNEKIIEQLIAGQNLEVSLVRELMERILSGVMPNAQIAATLVLLRAKKESAQEIATAAEVVLEKATSIERPSYPFADVVGTGGDGYNTINVSTLSSFTAASLGLPIAKHGNISVSSKCGSADVLRELGVDISLDAHAARKSLDRNRWCFLFAPNYHATFKSVKSLRQELRIRTLFNILGPLVNPLRPPIMLIGVYDRAFIMPFAEALRDLGRQRAMIVFGSGLDEIALHGPTEAALLDDRSITTLTLTPNDLGLKTFPLTDMTGGEPSDNARDFVRLLSGEENDARTSLVAASAGVLLWLAERAKTFGDGVNQAKAAIYDKAPLRVLDVIRGGQHGAS